MKNYQPNPYLLGGIIFAIQLTLIIVCIIPNKSIIDAWLSLGTHWDSEWYAAIAKYGYINIDGPYNTGLQNANVVFFPGYPILARYVHKVFHIDSQLSLLIVSQFFCLCFWILVCKIINKDKLLEQICALILIAIFPTSWFFYMGYAESSFTFTVLLTIWLYTKEKWLLSSLAALFMTATRIIGMPVLIVPVLTTIIINIKKIYCLWNANKIHEIFNILFKPTLIGFIGILGVIGFLGYCHLKFGSWHLYFDMEKYGWNGEAYLLFLFKKETWLPPPFSYNLDLAPALPNYFGEILPKMFRLAAYTFSETLVPIFTWLMVIYTYVVCKCLKNINRESLAWFISAVLILIFS